MNRFCLGIWLLSLSTLAVSTNALAQAEADRFSAAGYYRIMTRPDFQGGNGKLGEWNLYGRLLNEGPYGILNLRYYFVLPDATNTEPWAVVNVRLEGSSFENADTGNGNFNFFHFSQLYVEAGNILLKNVTWRIGTLDYYPGDLGLYDMRPAELFYDTVGISGTYKTGKFDFLFGAGDAGYAIRGTNYDTIFSTGAWARYRITPHLEIGLGGQGYFEPSIAGNQQAPYQTPGVTYVDYYRKEVVQNYLLANPGMEDQFPGPAARSSSSGRAVWYLGFGGFGPVMWDSLYGYYMLRHPDNYYVENYQGKDYTIYIHDLTDQRTELLLGNELDFHIIPGHLDGAFAQLIGQDRNPDNTQVAGEDNRNFASVVLRTQAYLTDRVHYLFETSFAREHSLNGNLWREHVDSVFTSTNGLSDPRGLSFGDTDTRYTWQGKTGFVFNPSGKGIYNRPSLRLLYGVQYSNQQEAFGNSFNQNLSQYNYFPDVERHWHHVVALEAEGWF
ncbi:MAG: hypothetical protein JST54_25820 [Deltaproteobacteria bacterium]|nr:hypothetical protein [Deltaproteobacteria bacterium]